MEYTQKKQQHIPYPKIGQFRQVIKAVRERHDYQGKDEDGNPIFRHETPYPKRVYEGTVKVHGTNAGIVIDKSGQVTFQSRNRVLSIGSDNMGFALAMSKAIPQIKKLIEGLYFDDNIVLYGEWCGPGVQKGVAVSELKNKIFIVFGLMVDGEWWEYLGHDTSVGIYNINQFPKHFVTVDFNNPEIAQQEIVKLTMGVEEACPVGQHFGIRGIGEGLVFTDVLDKNLRFKSKGEKHSSSKVKTLASVDVEKLESVREFVEYACTESRLSQGLENIELDAKNTGAYIKWVMNDIYAEEQDTIVENQVDWKMACGQIAKKAKEFFFTGI